MFIPIDRARDVPVCRSVMELMGNSPSYLFGDVSSADVAIGVISRMKLIVSMRLHALVFAAGQDVPVIGAVYDPKVSSFLDYIGVKSHAPLQDITEEFLIQWIDEYASGRMSAKGAEDILKLEKRNGEIASELLTGSSSAVSGQGEN